MSKMKSKFKASLEIFNIDVETRFHEIKKHQEFAAPVPVPLSVDMCLCFTGWLVSKSKCKNHVIFE